jgi:hypothetical protein
MSSIDSRVKSYVVADALQHLKALSAANLIRDALRLVCAKSVRYPRSGTANIEAVPL